MIYWRSQVLTYKNIRSIMGGKSSLGDWLWRYCMEKDELKQEIETEEKKKEHIDKINKILDMLPCNECERMLHYMLVLFFS